MANQMENWECACGATFVDEEDAAAHLGSGHPWLSKMVDGNLTFIHVADEEWWALETTPPEEAVG